MSTSNAEFVIEAAGAYPVDQVRYFLDDLKASAEAALQPALGLSGDTRPIAASLMRALLAFGQTFTDALAKRRSLQGQASRTRRDVLRQEWEAYAAETLAEMATTHQTSTTAESELRDALRIAALPVSSDPATVLLARQELELALRIVDDDELPFVEMIEQARRGGDIAAAAASEWGRMILISAAGSDIGYDDVQAAAIATAANSDDPAKRAAAAALLALDTPKPGSRIPALAEARADASFITEATRQMLTSGIVLPD